MFDTMTITKTVGALCGSLLVLLLGKWAAEILYQTAPAAHGDAEITQAYVIDTGDEGGEEEVAEEGPSFEEVLASADPAAGEKVFAKCRACHKLDGTNGTGPHLDGVVNREIGGLPDFRYSDAMAGMGGVWDAAALDAFLENPRNYVPGTKMSFAGLPKVQERADVVAYLESIGG